MKVSGFTFVRNGLIYDYPFRESIRSVLPLVDEMIVNVPFSDDKTYEAVMDIGSPKLKVFQTEWGGEVPTGGRILSYHTNLALKKCSGDWCFYIQADEVINENDNDKISKAMTDNIKNPMVSGLLFDYLHFYGSYDCIATARNWYRKEIRIIRNKHDIISYADAQGFRYTDGSKVVAAYTGAKIYHYGWVRPIDSMRVKTIAMDRLWHGDKKDEENKKLEYKTNKYGLRKYKGTHPAVMKDRIKAKNWDFEYSSRVSSYKEFRYWFSDVMEKIFGKRFFEYKGYKW